MKYGSEAHFEARTCPGDEPVLPVMCEARPAAAVPKRPLRNLQGGRGGGAGFVQQNRILTR